MTALEGNAAIAAQVLEETALRLIKEHHFNDAIAANLCIAMLDVISPLGAVGQDTLTREQRLEAINARAIKALKVLNQISEHQKKYDKKELGFDKAYPPAFKETKSVMWNEICHGWLNTRDRTTERKLADGLLGSYAEGLYGESNILDKVVRKKLKEVAGVSDRFERMLARVTESSNSIVVDLVLHRLINSLEGVEAAKRLASGAAAAA